MMTRCVVYQRWPIPPFPVRVMLPPDSWLRRQRRGRATLQSLPVGLYPPPISCCEAPIHWSARLGDVARNAVLRDRSGGWQP